MAAEIKNCSQPNVREYCDITGYNFITNIILIVLFLTCYEQKK